MAERQGVQIDYCPSCRGIWLDHGELEKILQYEQRFSRNGMQEQLDPLMPPPTADRQMQDRQQRYQGDDYNNYDYRYGRGDRRGRRRRDDDDDDDGGFFGQIMGIFD